MAGKIILVATPIGNLKDLSPRGQEALQAASLVACEDTRRTGRLLAHLGLSRPLLSLHEHNERRRIDSVLQAVEDGGTVALTSDAGTPLISDPGFQLVREALVRGYTVEAIPGACAILVALVLSGLPPYPFTFGGFPPHRQGRRRTFYRRFAALEHTLVFFESPHRLLASLGDAATELGDRAAAVCRELTKLHEEIVRGRLEELAYKLAERPSLKGEYVLVVGSPAAGSGPGDQGQDWPRLDPSAETCPR